jgi:ADP-heptose:LPS heptosyltransferase/predicted SAM-dependent methyltransferase
MVWRLENPQGWEAAKARWEMPIWTRGKGLELGCGPAKTFPHFLGVDNGRDAALYGNVNKPDVLVESATDLSIFASGSMDFIVASHLLEHIPLTHEDPRKSNVVIMRAIADKIAFEKHTACEALREWMRVLKVGGNLVLLVPDEDEYPKVGEHGANPDHTFNCNYDVIVDLMKKTGCAWDLADFQKRNADQEYSLWFVFTKRNSGQHFSWKNIVKPAKSVGVCRYGAIGDNIQVSSVLAGLKQQGFHVTYYTSPPANEVLLHDPHIDAFYLQDKDQVPNHLLGEFWSYHAGKYDKWVNLSESVEVSLLATPGKTTHTWSPAARHRLMNHNYVEMSHLIAGVPHKPQVHFYPLPSEREWAKKERAKLGGEPLILWAMTGSSIHKTWGGLDATIAAIMIEFQNARVVMVGGQDAQILEQGWENEPRVLPRCGAYKIRETLALLEFVDVMIGPETGVMNAAAQLPCPKVVFLSHSTHENLTRDWTNVYALASKDTNCPGRGNNEAPACHQLHFSWQHCKQFREAGHPQDGTAQCQADIDGEAAWMMIRKAIASTIPQRLIQVA